MHIQAIKNYPVYFGKEDIPPAPAHVPEKYKQAWKSLPPCCRNFYLTPGSGCCAGLSEPNAKIMETPKTNPTDNQNKVKLDESTTAPRVCPTNAGKKQTVLQSLFNWFKHFLKGLWEDFKLIFIGSR